MALAKTAHASNMMQELVKQLILSK